MITLVTSRDGDQPFTRILRALASGLAELGVQSDLVFLQGEPGFRRLDSLRREGSLGVARARRMVGPLRRYLVHERPRACLVTPSNLTPLALVAGRLANHPVVVPRDGGMVRHDMQAHVRAYGLRRYRLVPPLLAATLRWAPGVVVVSEAVRDHLQAELPRATRHMRFAVVPNAIEPVEGETPSGDGAGHPLRLVAVGRLVRQKGHDVLIEALHRAAPNLPAGWSCEILGSGPLEADLRADISVRGLTDHVQLLGVVRDPFPAMARADLLVHAARWEPFGMVVLEAMAQGAPVVATRAPGAVPDLLDGGRAGRLVPTDDPAALAEAIVELARDPSERQRVGAAARVRAREQYSPRAAALTLLGALDRFGL